MKGGSTDGVAIAVAVMAGLAGPAKTAAAEQVRLSPAGISRDDRFGFSVSVSGGSAAVGAFGDDDHGETSGRVYIFGRDSGGANNWGQSGSFAPGDLVAYDKFGQSTSISGDLVIAGAPGDDDKGTEAGCAYVFARQAGGAYGQVSRLLPADLAGHDVFGTSVSISGDIAVVGAPGDDEHGSSAGAAYVFGRDVGGTNNWGQITKLHAGDPQPGDFFGLSVSVDGDFVIIGAPGDDPYGASSGSAYVFGRNTGGAGNWGQAAKLTAGDGEMGESFGYSVAIDAGHVVVGAYVDDDQGASSGSAYLFDRDFGGFDNWGQVKKLLPDDGAEGDLFGRSVSISGERVVCGALGNDDFSEDAGAAYVFGRNTGGAGNWGQLAKIRAGNPSTGAAFGCAVAADHHILCVAAYTGITNGIESGATCIHHLPEPAAAALIALGGTVLLIRTKR